MTMFIIAGRHVLSETKIFSEVKRSGERELA